jgi:hypothetical protein
VREGTACTTDAFGLHASSRAQSLFERHERGDGARAGRARPLEPPRRAAPLAVGLRARPCGSPGARRQSCGGRQAEVRRDTSPMVGTEPPSVLQSCGQPAIRRSPSRANRSDSEAAGWLSPGQCQAAAPSALSARACTACRRIDPRSPASARAHDECAPCHQRGQELFSENATFTWQSGLATSEVAYFDFRVRGR